VRFGPEEGAAVLLPGNRLDGLPADEGVVTDEGRTVSAADGELD